MKAASTAPWVRWLPGLRSVENVSQKKILMVPIGMGCLDVACAGIVYKKAISMGLGETFMFDQK